MSVSATAMIDLDISKLTNEIGHGWVGGPLNQRGLKATYWIEPREGASSFDPRIPDHRVRSELCLGDWHTGYPATIHGGAIGAWLDDAMARAASMAFPPGIWAVTSELRTRYQLPIEPHTELQLEVYLAKMEGGDLLTRGRVTLPDGRAAVRAEGRYVVMPERMRQRILLATGLERVCV